MKRFHVNVSVADLAQSIEFYKTLFGQDPDVIKSDYAKWMLDDPRVNFAINESSGARGVNHIGLQADTLDELAEIQGRLKQAGTQTFDQPEAECCDIEYHPVPAVGRHDGHAITGLQSLRLQGALPACYLGRCFRPGVIAPATISILSVSEGLRCGRID